MAGCMAGPESTRDYNYNIIADLRCADTDDTRRQTTVRRLQHYLAITPLKKLYKCIVWD